MKKTNFRENSVSDLMDKLTDLKKELFNLRFQNAINQLENPMRIQAVKRDIARIKTEMRRREIEAGGEAL